MNTEKNSVVEEMFKNGAHYGYSRRRRHPTTVPYIFSTRNGVDVIDIEKSYDLLEKAMEKITSIAQSGKTILFVGTKAEAKKQIIEIATSLNMPYVSERWIGGALTNFSEIKKRIAKLLDLRQKKENGELDKYTKKERLLIDREVNDMSKNFEGLTGVTRTPDILLIIDPKKEHIAVTEAHKMNLEVISLMNTDCNMKNSEYPVVSNDASVSSISFFLNKVLEAYKIGKNTDTK